MAFTPNLPVHEPTDILVDDVPANGGYMFTDFGYTLYYLTPTGAIWRLQMLDSQPSFQVDMD